MNASTRTVRSPLRRRRLPFALPRRRSLAAWLAWIRPEAAIVVAAAVAGAAVVVVIAGDVLLRPGWFALFSAYNVLAFAAAGLLWLDRRPGSRMGVLLLGMTAVVTLSALQGASSSLAFSIGVLFDPVLILLWSYILLTYPASRLTRPARGVLGLAWAAVLVGFVPWFFLSPHVAGGTPLARCTAACPENALMIANRPDVAVHFGRAEEILRITFAVAFIALIVWRMAAAGRAGRRVLAPVYAIAAVWLAVFGAYGVARYLAVTDAHVWDTLGWVLTGTRAALPLAFVLALVLAQMYAAGALATMMRRLSVRPDETELERAARGALGDPSLQLAAWHPAEEQWLATDRRPIEPPAVGSGRSWRELRTEADTPAALAYDSIADTDPELLTAIASGLALGLDRAYEQGEAHLVRSELRESQRQAERASADERRRLEQDLHDGLQQQLVAMRIHMALAGERIAVDSGTAGEEIASLTKQLDAALNEVRAVAHRTYPQRLREDGIEAALMQSVRAHPRVRLRRGNLRRYPEGIEAAVYFATLDAIHSAAARGGDSSITVALWEEPGELRFEVREPSPGAGSYEVEDRAVAEMSDRLHALGGRLDISSTATGGRRVTGRVPLRR